MQRGSPYPIETRERVVELWRRGDKKWVELADLFGIGGHDFVLLDLEHSAIDAWTLETMILAADAHRMIPLVKLKEVDEVGVRNPSTPGRSASSRRT